MSRPIVYFMPGKRRMKYVLIADELRSRIGSGRYEIGVNLPSEAALAGEFGVSRMTVRQALQELEGDMLIVRSHGKGTVVVDQRYHRSTTGLRGIFEDLTEAGHKPGAKVLGFTQEVPTAEVAAELQLACGELAFAMTRLRTVDGQPLGLHSTYLSARHLPGLTGADLEDASLYGLLEGRFHLRLLESVQTLGARTTTEVESRLLKVAPNSAVVTVRRNTVLASGEPIEFMRGAYRSDLVSYVSTLRRGAATSVDNFEPKMALGMTN